MFGSEDRPTVLAVNCLAWPGRGRWMPNSAGGFVHIALPGRLPGPIGLSGAICVQRHRESCRWQPTAATTEAQSNSRNSSKSTHSLTHTPFPKLANLRPAIRRGGKAQPLSVDNMSASGRTLNKQAALLRHNTQCRSLIQISVFVCVCVFGEL